MLINKVLKNVCLAGWLASAVCLCADDKGVTAVPEGEANDPYQWLEDVTGEKALDWVRARNAKAEAQLQSDPAYKPLFEDLLAILDSDARIPMIAKHGDYFYNFWRDQQNERGLWRRTTMEEYRKANPKWDVLLDLDKLAAAEKENWVWGGVQVLRPYTSRCLIHLSRGGADADVTREFDMERREFVPDGFVRPESKGGMSWIDHDRVFVFTDFGDGSMTKSG